MATLNSNLQERRRFRKSSNEGESNSSALEELMPESLPLAISTTKEDNELDWDLHSIEDIDTTSPTSATSFGSLWSQLDSFPQYPVGKKNRVTASTSPTSPSRFIELHLPSSPPKSLPPSPKKNYNHLSMSSTSSLPPDFLPPSTPDTFSSEEFDPLTPPQLSLPSVPPSVPSRCLSFGQSSELTAGIESMLHKDFIIESSALLDPFPTQDNYQLPPSQLLPPTPITRIRIRTSTESTIRSSPPPVSPLPVIVDPLLSFNQDDLYEESSSADELNLSILRASLQSEGLLLASGTEYDSSSDDEVGLKSEEPASILLRRKSLHAINLAAKRRDSALEIANCEIGLTASQSWSQRQSSLPYKLRRRPSDIPTPPPSTSKFNRIESVREDSSDEEELFDLSFSHLPRSSSTSSAGPLIGEYRFPNVAPRRASETALPVVKREIGSSRSRRRTVDHLIVKREKEILKEEKESRLQSWKEDNLENNNIQFVQTAIIATASKLRRKSVPSSISSAIQSTTAVSRLKPPSGLRKLKLVSKSPPLSPTDATNRSIPVNRSPPGIPRKSLLPYVSSLPIFSGSKTPVRSREVSGVAL